MDHLSPAGCVNYDLRYVTQSGGNVQMSVGIVCVFDLKVLSGID